MRITATTDDPYECAALEAAGWKQAMVTSGRSHCEFVWHWPHEISPTNLAIVAEAKRAERLVTIDEDAHGMSFQEDKWNWAPERRGQTRPREYDRDYLPREPECTCTGLAGCGLHRCEVHDAPGRFEMGRLTDGHHR